MRQGRIAMILLLQSNVYYFMNYTDAKLYTPRFQYQVPEKLLLCDIIGTPLLFRCAAGLFDVSGELVSAQLPYKVGKVTIMQEEVQFSCLERNAYDIFNETHFVVHNKNRTCLVDVRCKWHCAEIIVYESALEKVRKLDALDLNSRLLQLHVEFNKRLELITLLQDNLTACQQDRQDVETKSNQIYRELESVKLQFDKYTTECNALLQTKAVHDKEELENKIANQLHECERQLANCTQHLEQSRVKLANLSQSYTDLQAQTLELQLAKAPECHTAKPETPPNQLPEPVPVVAQHKTRAQRGISIANNLIMCTATVSLAIYWILVGALSRRT